jgi:hypothetical protein
MEMSSVYHYWLGLLVMAVFVLIGYGFAYGT